MNTYSVALWRFWKENAFPIVADVSASSPLVAALTLMDRCHLKHVACAGVHLPGYPVLYFDCGLSLYTEGMQDD